MEFFTWMTPITRILFILMVFFYCYGAYELAATFLMASPKFIVWLVLVVQYTRFFYERSLDWKSFQLRRVMDPEISSYP